MTETAVAAPVPNAELLSQPAARAVRVVALAKLDDIAQGYAMLAGGDPEGLHDLRVAIRRLRTWLRAYRPFVDDALRRKTRRRLRELAQATSDARDAEVGAEWVESESDPPSSARAGFEDAARRLGAERDHALRRVRTTVERDLPSLIGRLKKELALPFEMPEERTATMAPPASPPPLAESMGDASRVVIDQHKARLARALEEVTSMSDIDEAHRARIAAKRLRYLLEPMYEAGEVKAIVAPLVSLQDALGAARDSHQLALRFVREVGEWAARDARQHALHVIGVDADSKTPSSFSSVRSGLIELARRSHVREVEEYGNFLAEWGPERVAGNLERLP